MNLTKITYQRKNYKDIFIKYIYLFLLFVGFGCLGNSQDLLGSINGITSGL